MKTKEKSWLWKLTGPFASKNYTTVIDTIYYPKGKYPSRKIIAHEMIHMEQIKRVGVFSFYFKYLLCFPFVYNKWRWDWEMEAYMYGHGYSKKETSDILKTSMYGWLKEPK